MNVAVIPARGGRKRIPRKNIRYFCGKPIITYSIEAAKESGLFDRIIVSTEDPEIAAIAEGCGIEVPFLRPAELAKDHIGGIEAIRHAIDWCQHHLEKPDYVCRIYATAPFIEASKICEGYTTLVNNPGTEFTFAATTYDFPIFRAFQLETTGTTKMFWPEYEHTMSQDLPDAFHDAGQFCWASNETWQEKDDIFTACSRIVLLDRSMVQDIDTLEDWRQAEALYKVLESTRSSN